MGGIRDDWAAPAEATGIDLPDPDRLTGGVLAAPAVIEATIEGPAPDAGSPRNQVAEE